MKLKLTHNFVALHRQLAQLQTDLSKTVVPATVNALARQARSVVAQAVSEELPNLPEAVIRRMLRLRRPISSAGRTVAAIELVRRPPVQRGRAPVIVRPRQTAPGVVIRTGRTGAPLHLPGAVLIKHGRHRGQLRISGRIVPVQAVVAQPQNVSNVSPAIEKAFQKAFQSARTRSRVQQFIDREFPAEFEQRARGAFARFNGTGSSRQVNNGLRLNRVVASVITRLIRRKF